MAELNFQYKIARNGLGEGREVTEESFIRKSLINLYAASDTREDVEQVEFSPVTTEDVYMIRTKTLNDVSGSYTWNYKIKTGVTTEHVTEEVNGYTVEKDVTKDVIERLSKTRAFVRENYEYTTYRSLNQDRNDIWDEAVPPHEKDVFGVHTDGFAVAEDPAAQGFPMQDGQKLLNEGEKDAKKSFQTMVMYDKAVQRDISNESGAADNYEVRHRDNKYQLLNWNAQEETLDVKSVDVDVVKFKRYMMSFEYNGQKAYMQQYSSWNKPKCIREQVRRDPDEYKKEDEQNEETRKKLIAEELQAEIEKTPELTALMEQRKKMKKLSPLVGVAAVVIGLLLKMNIIGAIGIIAAIVVYNMAKEGGNEEAVKKLKEVEEQITAKYTPSKEQVGPVGAAKKLNDRKMELLDARLVRMGYAPLTEEEKDIFAINVFCVDYEEGGFEFPEKEKKHKLICKRIDNDDEYVIDDSECYDFRCEYTGMYRVVEKDEFEDDEE